jgi:hypothetical protein
MRLTRLTVGTTESHASYYNDLVASVRLDPDLDARLERAAALRGESKSDFIRAAIGERIDATLETSLVDRLAHVIGQLDLGGGQADRAHELAGLRIRESHDRGLERRRRRS